MQLIAYDENLQQPASDSTRGEAPIPVLYDSRQAYVTFAGGLRLSARPQLYVGFDKIYDFPSLNEASARQSPYDINSMRCIA